jgi:hypothetical protein
MAAIVASSAQYSASNQQTVPTIASFSNAVGDCLILQCNTYRSGGGIVLTPAGWTRLAANTTTATGLSVIFKEAEDENEAAPSFDYFSNTDAGAGNCDWLVFQFSFNTFQGDEGVPDNSNVDSVVTDAVDVTTSNTFTLAFDDPAIYTFHFSWEGTGPTDADHDSDAGWAGTSISYHEDSNQSAATAILEIDPWAGGPLSTFSSVAESSAARGNMTIAWVGGGAGGSVPLTPNGYRPLLFRC